MQEGLEPGPGALRRWGSYRDLGLAWGSGAVTRGAGPDPGAGGTHAAAGPHTQPGQGARGWGYRKK